MSEYEGKYDKRLLGIWRCDNCDEVSKSSDLLIAPSPFDKKDIVVGCQHCNGINQFTALCDADGCLRPATIGTLTPDGYRRTCSEHRPETKEVSDEYDSL